MKLRLHFTFDRPQEAGYMQGWSEETFKNSTATQVLPPAMGAHSLRVDTTSVADASKLIQKVDSVT